MSDAEKCKYRYPSVGGVCNQAAELHRGAGALSHPFTPAPATACAMPLGGDQTGRGFPLCENPRCPSWPRPHDHGKPATAGLVLARWYRVNMTIVDAATKCRIATVADSWESDAVPSAEVGTANADLIARAPELRAEVEHHKNTVESLILQRDTAEAEVAALRRNGDKALRDAYTRVAALETTLREIADLSAQTSIVHIARAALEGK